MLIIHKPQNRLANQIRQSTDQNESIIFAPHSLVMRISVPSLFTAPSFLVVLQFQLTALCNDIWLPKQDGIQFGIPDACSIYIPLPPSCFNYRK